MKKYILFVVFIYLLVLDSKAQNVGISANGATPNASAMLDIDVTSLATKRGLLIPRMTYAEKMAFSSPLPAVAQGLIVYQTDAVAGFPQGFYYNTNSLTTTATWVLIGGGSGWALTGNAGTVAGTNFIGTTDSIPFFLRVNNHAAGRIGLLGSSGDYNNTSFGNSAMPNVTGANNTAYGALALSGNTAGANNTAVGANAIKANAGNDNSALGATALQANTSVGFNTAFGSGDAKLNTLGTGNVAEGANSLSSNLLGNDNTAVGRDAMSNYVGSGAGGTGGNTAVGRSAMAGTSGFSGSNNTAIGNQAMFKVTTGNENTVVGHNALFNATTGSGAVAIGAGALYNANAFGNVAVGDSALFNNTTGVNNVAVGYKAATALTTGQQNVIIGQYAGLTNNGSLNVIVGDSAFGTGLASTAIQSVAIGNAAMKTVTSGGQNTAIGYAALYSDLTGASNVAIGNAALYYTTAGSNTGIGFQTGLVNTTGTSNTYIGAGANATAGSTALTFSTAIGAGATVGASSSIVIGRAGTDHVGIGTATPSAAHALHVVGNTFLCGTLQVSGTITCPSALVVAAAACPSDRRFKKNILPMQNALDNVLKLQGVTYDWKLDEFPNRGFKNEKQFGFIAQDVEKIYPQMVVTGEDGYKAVDYGRLTPVLVEAIKTLEKSIEERNKKIEALSAEVKEIKIANSKKEASAEVGVKK